MISTQGIPSCFAKTTKQWNAHTIYMVKDNARSVRSVGRVSQSMANFTAAVRQTCTAMCGTLDPHNSGYKDLYLVGYSAV
jgi:hypothetical protein